MKKIENIIEIKSNNLQILNTYLPPGAFYFLLPYFEKYEILIVIKRIRKPCLGLYNSPRYEIKHHTITISDRLNNPQLFLFVLLHEIAHLITRLNYGYFSKLDGRVKLKIHGEEWQSEFRKIL